MYEKGGRFMLYQKLSISDIQKNKQLFKVWNLVCEAHKGQKRKGAKKGVQPDYVTHLFKVLEIMANAFGNPKKTLHNEKLLPLFVVALMHDVIEDTVINSQEKLAWVLEPVLGKSVAQNISFIVKELSNPASGFVGTTPQEQDEVKKQWQINHVKNISIFAKMVKMADQISNMADCGDIEMTKINQYGKKIQVWSDDKKKCYLDKALSVCQSCLTGITDISYEQKNTFQQLMLLANSVYDYSLLKMNNPLVHRLDFFDTINYSFQQTKPLLVERSFLIKKASVDIKSNTINTR